MKVKINDTWYDSEDTPICLELTEIDQELIDKMCGSKIAFFPDDYTNREEMLEWMD